MVARPGRERKRVPHQGARSLARARARTHTNKMHRTPRAYHVTFVLLHRSVWCTSCGSNVLIRLGKRMEEKTAARAAGKSLGKENSSPIHPYPSARARCARAVTKRAPLGAPETGAHAGARPRRPRRRRRQPPHTHTPAQPQQGQRCDVGSAKPRQWAREAAKEGSGSGVVSAGAGRGRRRRSGCGRTAGASGTARARCDRARRRCRGRAGHRRAPTLQVALCRERRRRASDARRRIRRRHRRHMPANCTALRADGAFVHAPQQTTVKGKGGERIR